MSVPVGALASKSRPITVVNWSKDSSTEKSSSPRKLAGNTSRPYLLITKGFTYRLLGSGPGTASAALPRNSCGHLVTRLAVWSVRKKDLLIRTGRDACSPSRKEFRRPTAERREPGAAGVRSAGRARLAAGDSAARPG